MQTIGKVIRCGPGDYLVRAEDGTWFCRLRTKLKIEKQRVTSLVCVGDMVALDKMDSTVPGSVAGIAVDGTAVISEILPRATALTRLAPPDMPSRAPEQQVLAANIDLAVVVVAAVRPELKMGTIERYLIMARQAGIEPLVCINKVDQLGTDAEDATLGSKRVASIVDALQSRGIALILTSAESGYGIDELKRRLLGRTAVFMGASGVGKTSILKQMCPGFEAKTLSISLNTNKGRHSTTASSLVDIGGGYVADLPGLRTLGFWQLEQDVVRSEYEDIEEIGESCRFRDCSHTHEPGCAVKVAVQLGELDRERYERYVKIMKETSSRS